MSTLVKGKIYDIHSPDLRRSEIGQFLKYKDIRCQLHGEFLYRGAVFQRIKISGRDSYMFDINPQRAEFVERERPTMPGINPSP